MNNADAGGPSADLTELPAPKKMIEPRSKEDIERRVAQVHLAAERIGLWLKMFTGLTALAAAAIVIALVWDATQSSGVVVTPFSVPGSLAERGLTGEVVAAEVQDRLLALQTATESFRAEESYEADWGDDIKVEIPQTGVSIGELQRWLRGWLGRRTRVSGAVTKVGEELRITVRVTGQSVSATSVLSQGPEQDLDKTVGASALALFKHTQPYRYGVWLRRQDRLDEARAAFEEAANEQVGTERAWALIGLSGVAGESGDSREAIRLLKDAIEIDPQLALAHSNLAEVLRVEGREEEAFLASRTTVNLLRGSNHGKVASSAIPDLLAKQEWAQATSLADGARLLRAETARDQNFSSPIEKYRAAFRRADAFSIIHDWAAARRELGRWKDDEAALADQNNSDGETPYLNLALAQERWEDVAENLPAEPAKGEPAENPLAITNRAETLAYTGRLPEAARLVSGTPLDCYSCLIRRGTIAALSGNHTAAEKWFKAASDLAPSLPHAPQAWGRARLNRGDTKGALAQFRIAASRAPNWADPIAWRGQALARQGKHAAAVQQYRSAFQIAPKWGRLHLLWSHSLNRMGRVAEARDHAQLANRHGLSKLDRIGR